MNKYLMELYRWMLNDKITDLVIVNDFWVDWSHRYPGITYWDWLIEKMSNE